jgi:CheY-like chemotaxis protein
MNLTDFTILMVEDDPNDILLTQRAFMQASLVNPLRIVRDGEEAMNYLGGRDAYADRSRYPLPSLILLDLKLPKKSGLEVLEFLRAQPSLKQTPVIVLTSSQESADIERAYALGANSYLLKPVGFDGLLEMVKAIGMYWVLLNQSPDRLSPNARTPATARPPSALAP